MSRPYSSMQMQFDADDIFEPGCLGPRTRDDEANAIYVRFLSIPWVNLKLICGMRKFTKYNVANQVGS